MARAETLEEDPKSQGTADMLFPFCPARQPQQHPLLADRQLCTVLSSRLTQGPGRDTELALPFRLREVTRPTEGRGLRMRSAPHAPAVRHSSRSSPNVEHGRAILANWLSPANSIVT